MYDMKNLLCKANLIIEIEVGELPVISRSPT